MGYEGRKDRDGKWMDGTGWMLGWGVLERWRVGVGGGSLSSSWLGAIYGAAGEGAAGD